MDLCLHYAPQGLPQPEVPHGPLNDMHVCLMNALESRDGEGC